MDNLRKISDSLYLVGADDRKISLFERVYPIDNGMSYNSYLLTDEKTVLFDTVDKAVSQKFFENLKAALDGKKLDYVVVQHMEPDHSATLKELMKKYPESKIVCNAKVAAMFIQFFGECLSERFYEIKEGDCLNTGKHNLNFVFAPMVHWPEVTMTYDSTDKILFSADAFGHFGALNGKLFADQVNFEKYYEEDFCRYYANIVGKYGAQVQAVFKKLNGKEIKTICPLHGYIWRKDLNYIFEKYENYSKYLPERHGIAIFYGSVYGATESAAEKIACEFNSRGIETLLLDVSKEHYSKIIAACFNYPNLCFASITYNNGIFSPMEHALREIVAHNLQNRSVSFVQNGSWAPASAKLMREILENCKNFRFNENVLTIKSSLNSITENDIKDFVDSIIANAGPAFC